MPNGYGRGGGVRRGGGMGLGFRGSSPPWPYVGRGRGGLPRCGYYYDNAAARPEQPPVPGQESAPYGYTPYAPPMTREQELDYLKNQAKSVKDQLEQIDSRMRDLETGK